MIIEIASAKKTLDTHYSVHLKAPTSLAEFLESLKSATIKEHLGTMPERVSDSLPTGHPFKSPVLERTVFFETQALAKKTLKVSRDQFIDESIALAEQAREKSSESSILSHKALGSYIVEGYGGKFNSKYTNGLSDDEYYVFIEGLRALKRENIQFTTVPVPKKAIKLVTNGLNLGSNITAVFDTAAHGIVFEDFKVTALRVREHSNESFSLHADVRSKDNDHMTLLSTEDGISVRHHDFDGLIIVALDKQKAIQRARTYLTEKLADFEKHVLKIT